MAGRYYPQKDIETFDKFNKELVGDLNSGKDLEGVIIETPSTSVILQEVESGENDEGDDEGDKQQEAVDKERE